MPRQYVLGGWTPSQASRKLYLMPIWYAFPPGWFYSIVYPEEGFAKTRLEGGTPAPVKMTLHSLGGRADKLGMRCFYLLKISTLISTTARFFFEHLMPTKVMGNFSAKSLV